MKINAKITVFLIIGFFFVSISLGLMSIFSLLNNQKDNLGVFNNELLETSRELVQENATFFFRLLDKRLQENPALSAQDILKIIREIEPSYQRNTVVMDIKSRALLVGHDQPEISAFLDRPTVERYLNEMVLTRNKDFYLDNFDKFRTDKKGLIVPASAHFRIYDTYGLIVGHGRAMEIALVRIAFMKKKNTDYFKLYVLFSSFLYSLATVLAVLISMRFMKLFFITPLKQIGNGVNRVAKGDLSVRINIQAKDEIGDLAGSFNQMTEDLKNSTVSIEVLEKEQKRFQDVTASTGDWIWELDDQGRCTYSSLVVEKILGYKPEEVIGKYFYDFFHPDEREELKRKVFEVFAKKEVFKDFPNRNIRKDGQGVILETSSVPMINAEGKLLGYRGANRDVTARKQYEERLAMVNNCLLNFGADPLKNIQNLTIVCGEILNGVCSLYNRLEGGLLCSRGQWNVPSDYNPIDRPDGHICYDVIKQSGDQPFIVRNLPQTSYAQTDPNVTKYKLQTYIGMVVKSGGNPIGAICVVYQKDFIPSEDDKKFLGIIASAIGVEEGRKRAEDQLKATQAQLVQSAKMASVGLLAGGVAHEINNPLTGVLNNVQLIRMIAEAKKDFSIADFKELLTVIEDSALRCKRITQSLLDFSRASKGAFQKLSVNEIIDKVATLIEHELRLQNIAIQKELKPDIPSVLGDSQLLQQVIFDIISNARWAIQQKSEKEGGLISLKTEYEAEKKSVCLSISDNGIGMSKETQEHIFEPFFTTKQVGEGTGLGLSIVYNIIQAHQGTIEVESQVGKGSTFKIGLLVS